MALYAVLVTGLLVAAAAFIYEARVIVQDGVLQERAFAVLAGTNRVLDDVQDAETGQRGYLLTGAADYLRPYDRGARDVPEAMRKLRRMLEGDPPSMKLLQHVDPVLDDKLGELARTIDLSRGGDWHEAIALVKNDGAYDVRMTQSVGESAAR